MKHKFYMIIETHGSNEEHDQEKLDGFLSRVFENELAADGVVASNSQQIAQIWSQREVITLALKEEGYVFKYDLSLPVTKFEELVILTQSRIGDRGLAVGYGHVGDGNIHLNISVPPGGPAEEVEHLLEPWVYERIRDWSGSISAEHGIGLMKVKALGYSKAESSIQYMRKIKGLFDPAWILNPGKVCNYRDDKESDITFDTWGS